MTAASFWSLLAPAIEMAEDPESYGALAFVPVAIGFVVGAAFVMAAGMTKNGSFQLLHEKTQL